MQRKMRFNKLGKSASHRKAMLSNMAISLILHKRINTTTAKAKALRVYIEPLITKSKEDSTHQRRVVFRYLQNNDAVTELFREISPKIKDRPGGYTRILKTGIRHGDCAEMCIIELIDYNENYTSAKEEKDKSSRRSRRGAKKTAQKKEPALQPAGYEDDEDIYVEKGNDDSVNSTSTSGVDYDDYGFSDETSFEHESDNFNYDDMETEIMLAEPYTMDIKVFIDHDENKKLHARKEYTLVIEADIQTSDKENLKDMFLVNLRTSKMDILDEPIKDLEFAENKTGISTFLVSPKEIGMEIIEICLMENLIPVKTIPVTFEII